MKTSFSFFCLNPTVHCTVKFTIQVQGTDCYALFYHATDRSSFLPSYMNLDWIQKQSSMQAKQTSCECKSSQGTTCGQGSLSSHLGVIGIFSCNSRLIFYKRKQPWQSCSSKFTQRWAASGRVETGRIRTKGNIKKQNAVAKKEVHYYLLMLCFSLALFILDILVHCFAKFCIFDPTFSAACIHSFIHSFHFSLALQNEKEASL